MGLLLCVSVLISICVVVNTFSLPKLKDGWTFVPSRLGLPIPVSIANAMAGPQPLFNVESDVTLELYTMKNPIDPQILIPNKIETVTTSNFNRSLPTRIYIHGWQEYSGIMKKYFNDAYLNQAKQDVNLIAVNWEKSSRTLNYISARNRVEPIGSYLATFIDFLVNNDLASLNDITLIGFSLGAHIAGIAGKHLTSGKLTKIVGLDPAAPLFSIDKPNERLDKLDAKYVEIVHTSGTWLGFYDPIGTVSFYPNNGRTQVGCRWDISGTCSHLRAYKYFAESIYSPISFYGYPCESLDAMKSGNCKGVGARMGGEPGNFRAEAPIYYLETNTKSLYARGGSRDM